ncbi:TCR/Tet family MFS transporter [Roseibium litorale]|uniref:TCR/Tet family MFS transporter n=1 Tax=Roseibium litorale TaxID=2803841 RepID=A0ABR9CPN1_9HYPH|nr:TCR/Tet family MFS transporter [Roseibium litorale]MBD8892375.1 TCR/Tet family MFS transporter [Roseibium litorale]
MGEPVSTRKALIFIFATVTINSMGIGLIMPVLPSLLVELTGDTVGEAARWGGALSVVYALMQFLCGPTLGNLSDRYGRRPVLLISMLVLAVDYMIMAMAGSLAILFIGRTLSGVAGANFSSASAYIADVSTKEQRARNFGLIGAAFGIGFILGPVAGGFLGEYGSRAPFFAAAALSFANFLYGFFFLPETLREENRRPFDFKRGNPLGALKQLADYPSVRMYLLALLLFDIAHYVYPAVWSYYTGEAFGWGPAEIGGSLAVVGIGFAFVQGYLIRVLEPKLGPMKTLTFALGANVIAYAGLSVINAGWMVFLFLPFASLGALATPSFSALMANAIPDNAQGELQGFVSSVSGIAMVISPFVMTQLFSAFTADDAPVYFPGIPFVLAGILIVLSFLLTRVARSKDTSEEEAPA